MVSSLREMQKSPVPPMNFQSAGVKLKNSRTVSSSPVPRFPRARQGSGAGAVGGGEEAEMGGGGDAGRKEG